MPSRGRELLTYLCVFVGLWKNHKKIKKIIWRKTVDPQCFQGKNYKTKFSTSLILKKKFDKDNFENK
jgi:hypothetical protein